MECKIMLGDMEFSYELLYKRVKNINLHIKSDGTVWVSANRRHDISQIDSFVLSKAAWLKKHLKRIEANQAIPAATAYSEGELQNLVIRLCEAVYPYYEKLGIKKPQIKFRKMTSQWGNCRPKQGILTFNKNLRYAPYECIGYVVWHEWTHFLVSNHSQKFYDELSKVCPDWKQHRKRLKEIQIV